jgi:hypothetical protein
VKPLSPIERMVDKACGFNRAADSSLTVILCCPVCRKEKVTALEHEPKGTVKIVLPCPDCIESAGVKSPVYFDANMKLLEMRPIWRKARAAQPRVTLREAQGQAKCLMASKRRRKSP